MLATQLYNGKFELSLEGYYKTMSDLIAYKAGYSNLESSEAWQSYRNWWRRRVLWSRIFYSKEKRWN